jgi:hypothetical protein
MGSSIAAARLDVIYVFLTLKSPSILTRGFFHTSTQTYYFLKKRK